MDWQVHLEEGEQLRWSGRPAPRCFTFRHWIHSLFGLLLLPLVWLWLDGGQALVQSTGNRLWEWLPWLGVVVVLYLLCGHLVRARLAWESTFYAITDRHILTTGGWPINRRRQMCLAELRYFKVIPRGADLGSLLISGNQAHQKMVFACLEHPQRAIELLEKVVHENMSTGTE
ncbi:MAG: hypothetical protein C0624_07555 [Desulfuromonas sp.]|nr:MAG: hypothetical protein C0624_07555 [Desulfuromonas sp.]